MSLIATWTYEEGTNGSAIPNSANGVVSVSGTVVYATAAAVHGTLGAQLSAAAHALGYSAPAASFQASWYGKIATVGTGNSTICSARATSTHLGRVRVNTSGKFELADGSNSVVATSTSSYTGVAFRLDVRCDNTAGSSITLTARIYLASNTEGSTPDETITATFTTASTPTRFYFGGGTNGWVLNADTLRLYDDITTWPVAFAGATPAAGTASLTLTGGADTAAPSTATAALTLTASGAATLAAAGTAALALSAVGSAMLPGGGSAALTLTASGSGTASAAATASLALSASGAAAVRAAGTAGLTLSGTGTTGAMGTTTYGMTGGARSDRIIFLAKTSGGTSVKIGYSTSTSGGALVSPTYTTASAPDGNGEYRVDATGLTADTKYYWQVFDLGTAISSIFTTRTRPASIAGSTVKIALGSCCLTNSSQSTAAFGDLVTWDPHYLLHLGDAYYNGTSTNHLASQHRALWESQIAGVPDWDAALAAVAVEYVNSDHELNPDDTDTNTTNASSFNDFFKQTIPARLVDTASPPAGKYRSWVDSGIRFILIDIRNTDRSPGANTDNSSKTMLGATQKAWLKNELIDANDSITTALKVIISDVPWSGAPSLVNGIDKWWSYSTERQELADFITTNKVNVDFLHGDSHRIAVDATHNAWGGFPVICGSAFSQNGGGAETNGYWDAYYNNSGSAISTYMRLTYQWLNANTIQRTASGWDAINNVQQVSQVHTWSVVTAGASLTLIGSMSAMTPAAGTAALGLVASGAATAPASGAGSLTLSGTLSVGALPASASATLTLAAGGTAAGPATASASLTLTASGAARAPAAGTAQLTLTASGTGTGPTLASGSAFLALAAIAAALARPGGTAVITLTATGQPGDNPTPPERILTVAAEIRVRTVAAEQRVLHT